MVKLSLCRASDPKLVLTSQRLLFIAKRHHFDYGITASRIVVGPEGTKLFHKSLRHMRGGGVAHLNSGESTNRNREGSSIRIRFNLWNLIASSLL